MPIITDDTFFIASRLKEIDDSYFIVYNKEKSGYEVHNKRQGENTLCLVVPYSELDCRTELLVQKTRVENLDKLAREIEKNNEKMGGSYFALP